MDIRIESATSTVMHDYINNSTNITSTFSYQNYSNSFVINNSTVQNYKLYFTPTYTGSGSLRFGSDSPITGRAPQTILQLTKIG